MTKRGFLDRTGANQRIRELGERFGFEIDPDEKVGRLSVGWQQRVEILKALFRDARILVLDEPTAVLTPQETKEIFAVLRRLADEGHSIIFISHKLYEVLEIADRITVIRRGRVVGSRIPSETNEEDLAQLMVGRDVELVVDRGESHPGEPALVVEDLRVKTIAAARSSMSVSFEVRAGEIFGIAGVAGNGQDELVEAHHRPAPRRRADRSCWPARTSRPRASATCTSAGMSFVPADRHRFGLVLSYPLDRQPRPDRLLQRPVRQGDWSATNGRSESAPRRPSSSSTSGRPPPHVSAGTLSGGNQQKLDRRPRVRSRPEAARPRSADSRPRRRQHRVHPSPDDQEARRRHGRPARVGRA